ncbi:MAG: acyloxyacyl hydrolase [Microscillaceae bacterium]|nr:acyloxyacyl hydrolase [Microscillaceae bacterium]
MPMAALFHKFCGLAGFLILCNGPFSSLFAQTSPTPLALGLRGHYGFIIPHTEAIRDVSFSHPRGLELEVAWHLIGEKSWKNFATYPRVGAVLGFVDFDNPSVLGQSFHLSAFFEPFVAVRQRFNFSFRMGAGLAYLNQVYDAKTNPRNQFYSTPLSFILTANLMLNYRLSPALGLRLGGFYNHISNGGIQQPNKGINFPTLSLGLEYVWHPYDFNQKPKVDWRSLFPERLRLKAAFFGTAKTLDENNPKRYALVGLTGYASYVVGRLSALTGGLEWVFDDGLRERLQRAQDPAHPHRASLLIGHELLLGRFTFTQQWGMYIFRAYFGNPLFYQRYGLEFSPHRRFFVGVNLKAHADVAEFLDFRVGMIW